jgi:hypothetical protein
VGRADKAAPAVLKVAPEAPAVDLEVRVVPAAVLVAPVADREAKVVLEAVVAPAVPAVVLVDLADEKWMPSSTRS